jgi:hypothetical protein
VLVLVAQASPTQPLVTHTLTAMVIQHRDGPGGVTVLVAALAAASVVGGEGGELTSTLGGKF